MPEDFSKDMPAENLVEELDITDPQNFDNPEYGNLIRRWWDIKKPGFFGKNLGTVMMDISVQRVPENKRKDVHERPFDIHDRLDLILMLNESLHIRYDQDANNDAEPTEFSYSVPDIAFMLGGRILTEYRDKIFNNKKWIAYTVSAPLEGLIVGSILPITNHVYLEVAFTYSAADQIQPRYFREIAYEKTDLVENSLSVEYADSNQTGSIVDGKDWLKITNKEVMENNRDSLLIPLFGPNM